MYIKVFQIDPDWDKNKIKFCGLEETEQYQGSAQIDASLYHEVFAGDVDCVNLEGAYNKFNTAPPPTHRGHSVSVSDIIATEHNHYFVDRVGFARVEFDESLAHKPDNLLCCVMVEPGKPAYEGEIADELRAMKHAVGGRLESSAPFGEDIVLICNEMGKIRGLPPNRDIYGDTICGNFFIVGDNHDGEFCSLTDKQTADILARFAEPEFTESEGMTLQ